MFSKCIYFTFLLYKNKKSNFFVFFLDVEKYYRKENLAIKENI